MSTILVRTDTVDPHMFACTRGIVYLSDGTLVAAVVRDDASGTIELRASTARTAFTTGVTGTTFAPEYFSMTVDSADNIYCVYNYYTNAKQMVFQRFSKGTGNTWTADGATTIDTLVGSDWGRRDIEVFGEGNILVLATLVDRSVSPEGHGST